LLVATLALIVGPAQPRLNSAVARDYILGDADYSMPSSWFLIDDGDIGATVLNHESRFLERQIFFSGDLQYWYSTLTVSALEVMAIRKAARTNRGNGKLLLRGMIGRWPNCKYSRCGASDGKVSV
jgi:hypothetical protein